MRYHIPERKKEGAYGRLTRLMAEEVGCSPEFIKTVLAAMPKALMDLGEGDWVRTPLGVFKKAHRRGREIHIPGTDRKALVQERLVVRLKPGENLIRNL